MNGSKKAKVGKMPILHSKKAELIGNMYKVLHLTLEFRFFVKELFNLIFFFEGRVVVVFSYHSALSNCGPTE